RLSSRPMAAAALVAALPIVVWLLASWWGSRVPGVSSSRARTTVGWAWLVSMVASAGALLSWTEGSGTQASLSAGLAGLGYALSWPLLGSLALALHLRRSG